MPPRPSVPPLRTVRCTRYVTPLREGGSLPAIMEADDDGLYVVKFRGAGQGPKALAAELIAAAVGHAARSAGARDGSGRSRSRARHGGAGPRDPGAAGAERRSQRRDRLPAGLPAAGCARWLWRLSGACRGRRLVRCIPHQCRSHPAQSESPALASPALADRSRGRDLYPAWLERRSRGDCRECWSALPAHPGSRAVADRGLDSARRTRASHRV